MCFIHFRSVNRSLIFIGIRLQNNALAVINGGRRHSCPSFFKRTYTVAAGAYSIKCCGVKQSAVSCLIVSSGVNAQAFGNEPLVNLKVAYGNRIVVSFVIILSVTREGSIKVSVTIARITPVKEESVESGVRTNVSSKIPYVSARLISSHIIQFIMCDSNVRVTVCCSLALTCYLYSVGLRKFACSFICDRLKNILDLIELIGISNHVLTGIYNKSCLVVKQETNFLVVVTCSNGKHEGIRTVLYVKTVHLCSGR